MKYTQWLAIALCFTLFNLPKQVCAQQFSNALEYIDYISNEYNQILAAQWEYTKTIAHSKNAKRVEKRRVELLQTIKGAQKKVYGMPAYEGDAEFKNFVGKHLNVNYNIINDDYAKIIDMEEVAEQSYDLMEAYLLAKKMANEKLSDASEQMNVKMKEFAGKHNINIVEGEESKLTQKMKAANEVFAYQNELFLIFFKSQLQEVNFLSAQKSGDINAMEQAKNALGKYAKEGINDLSKFVQFKNDPSLYNSTKDILSFYQQEAENNMPTLIDFYLTQENYMKLKNNIEKMSVTNRTNEDIDKYNKAVDNFNKINTDLNQKRNELINAWNKTSQSFLNRHVP